MECLGCKAFHQSKDLKSGEKRKCFICGKENVKDKLFFDTLNGAMNQRKERADEFMDFFNKNI